MSGRRNRAQERPYRSQHFLHRGLAADLVARSSLSHRDHVVEIGAGRGVLTAELAGRCGSITAIEIDPALCRRLRDRFRGTPSVRIVEADFLLAQLPDAPYKVFSNVPYSRTADIVRHLRDAGRPPNEAMLILQTEAAGRFAGHPAGVETRQSLLLKPWWHVEVIRRLARTDFDPPPSVDSAVLWMARRGTPLVSPAEERRYQRLVHEAFGATGTDVAAGLQKFLSRTQITRLAHDLGFRITDKPSSLTFDQWLGVFRYYALQK
ncbi:MAG: 23S ribosomal RNA methyltransferase Erm [Chloroflexi bacterium]|nr:23S ribosomal RNA methyltransferase Erm [Chloroflexota bacterium]